MKILISGCSFSSNQMWPYYIKDAQLTSFAYPGAGNKYIADSIISSDIDLYDMVIVMWSGLTRLDIPVTTDFIDDYSYKNKINDQYYIMSGGRIGSWQAHQITTMLFKNLYKLLDNENLAMLSLLEIIKTQEFLKSKNKKFIFSSYVNYWNSPKDWTTRNGDFSLRYVDKAKYLIDKIDFDKWLFLNENKDGIYEYAVENAYLIGDKFHPSPEASLFWAQKTIEKIKEIYVTN